MDVQETNIYNAILITSVVIGSIIVFFIVSFIRHQRKNLELHRLNILAEITTLEKERARIAIDLHDELGPVLSAVKLKINSFDLYEPGDLIQKQKINAHIDDLLHKIRDVAFDLMPNALLRKGLPTALRELMNFLNTGSEISFVCECTSAVILNDQMAVNIYRIVQETVHNCIKHSGATVFVIQIQVIKSHLNMIISDNGKGFDVEREQRDNTGFGLRGLLSRTEILHGVMYLESVRGKGTTYTFEFPLA